MARLLPFSPRELARGRQVDGGEARGFPMFQNLADLRHSPAERRLGTVDQRDVGMAIEDFDDGECGSARGGDVVNDLADLLPTLARRHLRLLQDRIGEAGIELTPGVGCDLLQTLAVRSNGENKPNVLLGTNQSQGSEIRNRLPSARQRYRFDTVRQDCGAFRVRQRPVLSQTSRGYFFVLTDFLAWHSFDTETLKGRGVSGRGNLWRKY